jgi:ribosomal protein S17E
MGKAISNKIKAKAKIIYNEFKEDFGVEFKANKEFIKTMNLPLSKLTINLMSAYITRSVKKDKKEADSLKIKIDKNVIPTKTPKNVNITH